MIRFDIKTAVLARSLILFGLTASAMPHLALAQETSDWEPPKLDWGVPDVQGIWNYQTRSSLERPANYNGKLEISEQEMLETMV